MTNPVETLERLTVDDVPRPIGAVATLQRSDARRVAGKGESDQVHLELGDVFDLSILLEGLARVHRLNGLGIEAIGRARQAHAHHGVLDVADGLKVLLEALLVSLAQRRKAAQRIEFLADEVVDALSPKRQSV